MRENTTCYNNLNVFFLFCLNEREKRNRYLEISYVANIIFQSIVRQQKNLCLITEVVWTFIEFISSQNYHFEIALASLLFFKCLYIM